MTYDEVAEELTGRHPEAIKSQMFGMPCLKSGNKVFAGLFHGEMTFKLTGPDYDKAMTLAGAKQFDPGMGRPMKNWVQVPESQSDHWLNLAEAALADLTKK